MTILTMGILITFSNNNCEQDRQTSKKEGGQDSLDTILIDTSAIDCTRSRDVNPSQSRQ